MTYKPEEITEDMRVFLMTPLADYITELLDGKMASELEKATAVDEEHRDRHLDRYAMAKEIRELFIVLDDDNSSRG